MFRFYFDIGNFLFEIDLRLVHKSAIINQCFFLFVQC
jgi:hypothetical protein